MKRSLAVLTVLALAAFTACENKGTSGGPGATAPETNQTPLVRQPQQTFSLEVPALTTTIKQGEAKDVTVSIKRGTNFDQDVTLVCENVPKGVTVEPASAVIKSGDTEAKLKVSAAPDASVGDFTINVTGRPAQGAEASSHFKIKVEENKK